MVEPKFTSSFHFDFTILSVLISLGIGLQLKKELVSDLSKTFFSRVIDETTDVGVQSQLAAMVQYWDYKSGKMIVELLDMFVCVDGTAEKLNTAVLTLLNDLMIPKERYYSFFRHFSLIKLPVLDSLPVFFKDLLA